jgi:hypothetical protein
VLHKAKGDSVMTVDYIPRKSCTSLRRFFIYAAALHMPSCAFVTLRLCGVTLGFVRFR